MKSIASKTRSRTPWLALWTLCGMVAATSPAQAQFGGWGGWGGGGAGQQKQLGTVLTVPTQGLGTFMAQNITRQKNVNILKISQFAVGGTQLAVVNVTQGNTGAPAKTIYMPKSWVPFVKQININKTIIEQTSVGGTNSQTAVVDVAQGNTVTAPAHANYMFCPLWAAGPIVQVNSNVTVVTQLAVGGGNEQVAVIAVDQQNAGQLKVPKSSAGRLVQLNNNVTIVNQTAVGDNNSQTAVVSVSQGNG